MNNFKSGGFSKRNDYIGGRPKSDVNKYNTKKSFNKSDRGDRGGRGDYGSRSDGQRPERKMELFKTTCTTCGKPCEVPFKPDGSKPVLCRDCFSNKSPSSDRGQDRSFASRGESRPERSFTAPSKPSVPGVTKEEHLALAQLMTSLDVKVSEILNILKTANTSTTPEADAGEVAVKKVAAPKAVKSASPKIAPAKKAPAKATVAKKASTKAKAK